MLSLELLSIIDFSGGDGVMFALLPEIYNLKDLLWKSTSCEGKVSEKVLKATIGSRKVSLLEH